MKTADSNRISAYRDGKRPHIPNKHRVNTISSTRWRQFS